MFILKHSFMFPVLGWIESIEFKTRFRGDFGKDCLIEDNWNSYGIGVLLYTVLSCCILFLSHRTFK